MRSDVETTTLYLQDGRVLKGFRQYFQARESLAEISLGGQYQRVGPPTPWQWTLGNESVDQETAEKILREHMRGRL